MQVGNSPGCIRTRAVSLHRTQCAGERMLETVSAVEGDNAASPRHKIYQALECGFDGIEVFINIGVIKFHRRQDHGIRKVMQKLRPLVEESRIVFIALEDEVLALSELKTAAEVLGD